VDNGKVSDHHAIIPTEEHVNLSKLTPEERNIYDLVVRRCLAVLLPPFEYEETRLTIQIGKEKFAAKGKIIRSAGWKQAYSQGTFTDEDDTDSDVKEQNLPPINQGNRVDVKSCAIETGRTKPPARYNEATLLTAMENPAQGQMSEEIKSVLKTTSGLGTPATRADIIEKLFDTFYIERRGKELVPTSKGIQLIKIVPEDLRSAELTGKWEQELALISKGKANSDKFVNDMRAYASKLVSRVIASDAKYVHDNITREKCPECGKFLLEVKGKKGGVMRICPDRECGYRKSVSVETNARCPNCHKRLELRGEGEKRGFFCACGYREKLSDFEKRRTTSAAGKRDVEKYLQAQETQKPAGNTALAAQLAKWMEQNEGDHK
jgi:DNA topoisomerase-3